MKKSILSFFLGISFILIPRAYAIEEMTPDVMKKTTGQASVSVLVDDVIIEDVSLSMLYIDHDGDSGTPEDAGAIRIKYTHGIKTLRAIFDYTDRGGYLKREYGTIMRRDTNNSAGEEWADIITGGERKSSPLTIGTTKKLKLQSFMKANNMRAEGLREARKAFEILSTLGLDYSGDDKKNINIVMNATGMAQSAAALVYTAASGYANINSPADADRVGTEVALRSVSISGIEITLPTLEVNTDYDSTTYSVEAEGSWNNGAELIRMSHTGTAMAILGGNVEVSSN